MDKVKVVNEGNNMQGDDNTSIFHCFKSVWDLHLAIVATKIKLEQSQVINGGARGGSTAGGYAFKKLMLPVF